MARARLIAVASAAAFGLATAIIAAQAPAGQGRGGQGRGGQAPAGPQLPGGPPPASVDPTLAQGQGRGGSPIQMAHANISGANGLTGTATLYEIANSANGHMIQIVLTVEKAPPGMHGLHIHAVGKCEQPNYESAGGHYDPGPAGNPDPDVNHPYHMGDLPNLTVGANGIGNMNAYTTRVTMGGPTGLFDADGSALVIHANLDPLVSGPAGSGIAGGPRIACGVIER
jgi:Cu-Zn family superoxide dismutase